MLTQFLGGKILWYSEREKHGIIVTNDGTEFYFDISVVNGRKMPDFPEYKNAVVTFEMNEKIKDCRCAKNVTLA
jgi:cold shock CspA family protein